MVERVKPGLTLDAFMRLYDEDSWVEVVNGQVEKTAMPAGINHVETISNLYDILWPPTKANGWGRIYGDGLSCVLQVDDDGLRTVRIPDLAFIRQAALPAPADRDKPYMGAPALAVEVVSPTEGSGITMAKVADYLRFGSEQVWVLYPKQRELHQHFPDDTAPPVYRPGDTVQAALFPGVAFDVAAVFG